MSDMTITVETEALLVAMSNLTSACEAFTKPAAKVTADHIQDEARRRVARATGLTAEGISVQESQDGHGYIVQSDNSRMPNLPLWLEYGTKQGKPGSHSSLARPYFFVSATLEAGAHDARMREAVQDAIDAQGLGG